MNIELNELELQRFVDGELDQTASQAFVKQLDQDDKQWRQVAFMLLEQRQLDHHLSALSEDMPKTAAVSVKPNLMDQSAFRSLSLFGASLVSMLLIGISFGSWWQSPSDIVAYRPPKTAPTQSQPKAKSNKAKRSDSTKKTEPLVAPVELSPSPIPIGAQMIGDDLEMELLQHGFFLERKTNFINLTDPDGKELAIPVDQINIRYIGEKVFQ